MTLDEYQKIATKTDQFDASDSEGIIVALLGLAGESGSLLTLFKKKMRDGAAYEAIQRRVREELGDVLMPSVFTFYLPPVPLDNSQVTTANYNYDDGNELQLTLGLYSPENTDGSAKVLSLQGGIFGPTGPAARSAGLTWSLMTS
jgi:hypothetical protein